MVQVIKNISKKLLNRLHRLLIGYMRITGAKIEYTSNLSKFFKNDAPLMIKDSLGNSWWVGYYLSKCGIPCECFIDDGILKEGTQCNGINILSSSALSGFNGGVLRFVFADNNLTIGVLRLSRLSRKYKVSILCTSPHFKNNKKNEYNINRFLGFFRQRLIQGEVPTIFSNDCTAGRVYEALGVTPITPTINVLIEDDDYATFCENIDKYIDLQMIRSEDIRIYCPLYYPYDRDRESGVIDDIRVVFSHNLNNDDVVAQWNQRKRFINKRKYVFIYSDYQRAGSISFAKRFFEIKGNKLYISHNGVINTSDVDCVITWNTNWFFETNIPIELHFDLVGWINSL